MRTDKAVDRNYTPNPAWDAGGAGVIQFGEYTKTVPDMASSRPPRVLIRSVTDHELWRSTWRGKRFSEYYDCVGRSSWYLGKFQSDEAAIVAWETHLRQRGVIK